MPCRLEWRGVRAWWTGSCVFEETADLSCGEVDAQRREGQQVSGTEVVRFVGPERREQCACGFALRVLVGQYSLAKVPDGPRQVECLEGSFSRTAEALLREQLPVVRRFVRPTVLVMQCHHELAVERPCVDQCSHVE